MYNYVASVTYTDLTLTYDFGAAHADWSTYFSVTNAFDRGPPRAPPRHTSCSAPAPAVRTSRCSISSVAPTRSASSSISDASESAPRSCAAPTRESYDAKQVTRSRDVRRLRSAFCRSQRWRPRRPSDCDRACLNAIAEQYLAAVPTHDPSKAPLSSQARYTENGVELTLPDGLWRTRPRSASTVFSWTIRWWVKSVSIRGCRRTGRRSSWPRGCRSSITGSPRSRASSPARATSCKVETRLMRTCSGMRHVHSSCRCCRRPAVGRVRR